MQVISLSLAHLGFGLLMILSLIGLREVGRGFFTLCGWSGVVLSGAGLALSALPDRTSLAASDARSLLPWGLAATAFAFFAASWLALRAGRRDAAAPFHRALGIAAGLAVASQGWSLAVGRAPHNVPVGMLALAVADFLLSAALLGGVTLAMILGHWYLVQPGLAIEPLRRLAWLFIGLLAARTLMEAGEAAGAIVSGRISLTPPAGEVLAFPALVLAQRALFGLAGPLLLAPLVYRTVVMRSTMSATGLLYVAVALVWVGEFLSKYLLLPLRLV